MFKSINVGDKVFISAQNPQYVYNHLRGLVVDIWIDSGKFESTLAGVILEFRNVRINIPISSLIKICSEIKPYRAARVVP